MTSSQSVPSSGHPRGPGPRRRPRFGLRSLLIVAIAFCLLFGWIGRGFYRVRQEDAAIETILQSGGSLYTEPDRRLFGPPGALSEPSALPIFERFGDLFFRSVGWRQRPRVAKVELRLFDIDEPAAYAATAALARLPEIRSVSLMGPAFDDASLRSLDRLPQLEELCLLATRTTDGGLVAIAAPERIRHLHVEEHGRESSVLAGAGSLVSLRKVDIVNCSIAREDIVALASLPVLETIDLADVQLIGDDVLSPLEHAKALRNLEVDLASGGPHDSDDLQAIAAAPSLERLQISVDDADLPLFAASKKLRFFAARTVSEEAARDFSGDRPGCVIRTNRSAGPAVYLLDGEFIARPSTEPRY